MKNIAGRVWDDLKKFWWLLLALACYVFVVRTFLTASCPFFLTMGLPCAGCGMSRAVTYVATFQFERAFYMNPMAFAIVGFSIYVCFFRYVLGKNVPHFVAGIVIIFALMLVFYIVRMYLYFPERTPYVYNYGNLMERTIPGYREFVFSFVR